MSVTTIKAEKVVETALALLEREVILPRLVWRDAAGDFAGAKGDTISIRLPSYTKARKNTLRSGDARTRDTLEERKVDVTLTSRLYKDVEITDENLTLDIVDFTKQVMAPCLRSIVRGYEDEVATLMSGGTYAVELELDEANPYKTFVAARKALNKAQVPQSGRVLVVGADVEEFVLNATTWVANLAAAGDASALRDAQTGRIAGFQVVVSNAIDPTTAYAFHQTAYVLNTRAPKVPQGSPWGATMSEGGFALRAVQVLDPTDIVNVLATEAWVGTNVVMDDGYFDANGMFLPGETAPGDEVTLAQSAAADDIIDAVGHGFVAGDRVVFSELTGGNGLTTNREYFVIAANLAADTFKVSATPGGAAVNFTTDITAGKVRKDAHSMLVRAVKIVNAA